jgi:hypothetical protein
MECYWQIVGIDGFSKASIEAYKSEGDEGDSRLVAYSKGSWVTLSRNSMKPPRSSFRMISNLLSEFITQVTLAIQLLFTASDQHCLRSYIGQDGYVIVRLSTI